MVSGRAVCSRKRTHVTKHLKALAQPDGSGHRPMRFSALLGGNAMKLPRRRFLHLAASTAGFPAVSRVALAQAYPTRPVRWIVCFAAGGPNDIVARVIG